MQRHCQRCVRCTNSILRLDSVCGYCYGCHSAQPRCAAPPHDGKTACRPTAWQSSCIPPYCTPPLHMRLSLRSGGSATQQLNTYHSDSWWGHQTKHSSGPRAAVKLATWLQQLTSVQTAPLSAGKNTVSPWAASPIMPPPHTHCAQAVKAFAVVHCIRYAWAGAVLVPRRAALHTAAPCAGVPAQGRAQNMCLHPELSCQPCRAWPPAAYTAAYQCLSDLDLVHKSHRPPHAFRAAQCSAKQCIEQAWADAYATHVCYYYAVKKSCFSWGLSTSRPGLHRHCAAGSPLVAQQHSASAQPTLHSGPARLASRIRLQGPMCRRRALTHQTRTHNEQKRDRRERTHMSFATNAARINHNSCLCRCPASLAPSQSACSARQQTSRQCCAQRA